jgi:hypothetical protein
MTNIVVLEFITLDGVIQAGGGPEDGTSAAAFTLESTTTSPSGVIVANYRRAGEVRPDRSEFLSRAIGT